MNSGTRNKAHKKVQYQYQRLKNQGPKESWITEVKYNMLLVSVNDSLIYE